MDGINIRGRKLSFLFLLLLLFCSIAARASDDKWRISKSTHFIVYFKNAAQEFIDEVMSRSEDYYDQIAGNLGFTRYNFWLWDNRAKIYIYDDAGDYQLSAGQPAWSSGASFARDKIIYTFPYAQGFFETILPHELGHIIFREFVGVDNPAIPVWLDEGVASYQEKDRYSAAMELVKEAVKNDTLISLEKLFNLNPQTLSDNNPVQIFYAESISIVGYLIKEFGRDNFVVFCQYLRDKRDFVRAMRLVYPFEDITEFSHAWQKSVGDGYAHPVM